VGFDWPSANVRLARTTEAIQIIRKLWEGSKKEKDNKISGMNSVCFIEFNGQYLKSRCKTLHASFFGENTIIHGSKRRRNDPNCCKIHRWLLITT
jgi:alkanesulfonate monooxygenase SsuD/methylene tetrahydromethanopterin reductase-like flavin-dependent oxidoreductase (luciferase family)